MGKIHSLNGFLLRNKTGKYLIFQTDLIFLPTNEQETRIKIDPMLIC